ncbi:DNA-directed RNA polymerase sigma-70 factor [Planomonospora sphaerica]|uniref:DNA-directed RNA polymerase sigma-70 factor n=1 Tax=Planomonospora sphaerica TaxID=161355 RepID=A0A171DLF0_9ACTN|nr:hypothetical protein [Planomonospora sphaerica]GAT69701.1 DNA-directed RNA polymerase sigma-70 factor [Planomonospora sphaerica]
MNVCLSDLVPPLRWSDAAAIPLLRDQPDLPDAWWRSLPLPAVLAVLGPERLAEIVTEIALDHWPAASVGDVLPALYVLDPDEADEPCTAIALDRAGSWPGLLSFTGHDLRDQPFVQPRPLLHTLFGAVFARLSPVPGGSRTAAPEPARATAPEPVHEVSSEPVHEASPATARGSASKEASPGTVPEPVNGTAAGSEAAPEPVRGTASEPVRGSGSTGFSVFEPAPFPEHTTGPEPEAGHEPEHESGPRLTGAGGVPEEPAVPAFADEAEDGTADEAGAEARDEAEAEPGDEATAADADEPGDGAEAAGQDVPRRAPSLHALLDTAFLDLEDLSWAVAQNRVFTDDPAAVESLSKLFAVQPEVVRDAEAELRARLRRWLASDEAAPYRDHLTALRKTLGKAAPVDRLIDAADWHAWELHSLDVPAWQFVLATLPDYYLVGDWLVDGDIADLRHRTRDLISSAERPPTVGRALELVSTLGIHPEVAKEWLENVPQLRILGAGESARRANGASPRQAPSRPEPHPEPDPAPARPGPEPARRDGPEPFRQDRPEPARQSGPEPFREPAGEAGPPSPPGAADPFGAASSPGRPGFFESSFPPDAAARPLKDVSLTRRCFRQPDGRWWLRVDITADHLAGAECPLPSGFAAYLGMAPGDSRTVTSMVGEMTLRWRDRPVLESLVLLLHDVGAKEGGHLFLTLSEEGVLRARHLPAAASGTEPIARALRLVGYTAPSGTPEQAARVIATRIGMTGPVSQADLLARLRERGDRDLQSLLA